MTLEELRAAVIAIADSQGSAADVAEMVYELAEQLAPTARCGRRASHGYHQLHDGAGRFCLGNRDILIAESAPTCDICDRAQGDSPNATPADQPSDWNGDTGNHLTCEAFR